MGRSLFIIKDDEYTGQSGFAAKSIGIQPGPGLANNYASLNHKISLRDDFGWKEVQNLQRVFCCAEIWSDFPVEGLKFISAEIKCGDEDQRVDLLYLRNDGGIYPCELKLGGTSHDTHGQLIRYISDLNYQQIDTKWIVRQRNSYIKRTKPKESRFISRDNRELKEYLRNFNINDRHIRLIRNAGIIVDEDFSPQMLKAVRYLNEFCGFSIRLLRMDTFVAKDWEPRSTFYYARIDLVEIQ